MKYSDASYDSIMEKARKVFIDELKEKIKRINIYLQNDIKENTMTEMRIFFHSINGTASTLGLLHLASIGKENEQRLKSLAASGRLLDKDDIDYAAKSVRMVEQELEYIKPLAVNEDIEGPGNSYETSSEMGKILLIDDDVAVLKLLEGAFTPEGYTVYICDDPLSAMDIIAFGKPDIILLDIMMPNLNGYEVLSNIKSNPECEDICVIFLSAVDDMENKIKGMRAGVDDYITKPFEVREIVYRVEMILKRTNKFKEKLLKDSLTGAYSRSYFNERVNAELERYKRYGTVFSIAFIDIDHFKMVNDTYGHVAGDYVLQRLVLFLSQNIRECDSIFRYGGEEFIVLLPETDEDHASLAMDRIRDGLNREAIYFAGNTLNITFSCGIKQAGKEDNTISCLIESADKAMYAAKKIGRNEVIRYTDIGKEAVRKKSLLLVDDENTILKLISSRLSESGYDITTVPNGSKALEAVERNDFDAVVLDLMLPDISGLEVCRRIKGNVLRSSTRVIILSQKRGEDDIVNGFKCGADDYVTKPFSIRELEARIGRVLNR